MHICKRCRIGFTQQQRAAGHCPHCGAVFDNAELTALCIGLICTYVLSLLAPELIAALLQRGWTPPSDTEVLVRICMVTPLFLGTLLLLSYRYALWQGEALAAHPWLRLLWLPAAPGLFWAALVLVAGVAFVSLRRRCRPQRALALFLEDGALRHDHDRHRARR